MTPCKRFLFTFVKSTMPGNWWIMQKPYDRRTVLPGQKPGFIEVVEVSRYRHMLWAVPCDGTGHVDTNDLAKCTKDAEAKFSKMYPDAAVE